MDHEDIRKKVEDEIVNTEKIIEEYKEMAKPVSPDVAIGRISRIDATQNKSITESALREAEQKLKNLRHVLAKAGSPEFGICVKCKKPIPLGRILIRPESLYCVHCAK